MKLTIETKGAVKFEDLNPGDVFVDESGDICIKLDMHNTEGGPASAAIAGPFAGETYTHAHKGEFVEHFVGCLKPEEKEEE